MGEPIRILFTIPNFITAGSGRPMLNIIERLDRARFAPAVCVMRKGGELDKDVERLGIPFLEAPFAVSTRPYHTLVARCWRAARAFRSYRFHLWHSFHWANDWTEPIIARLAGARGWVFTKKNMPWNKRGRLRAALATRIIATNTDMLTKFFQSGALRRKTKLIARGVDTFRFAPSEVRRLRVAQSLGLQNGAVMLTSVAHLVPIKGHSTLLHAIHGLPSVHLILAGQELDKGYSASIRSLAQTLGIADRTHFIGAVCDIPALMAETNIFALASNLPGEGCPVALLEAMACGKPSIATDVPGSRDVIEHGKSGLLVPPGDAKAMGEALRTLISYPDLQIRLGSAARQRILERFTVEREVTAHEALYTELAK